MNNFSLPLRYGLIGGFVMCIVSLISYLFYSQLFSSFTLQMLYGLAMYGFIIFITVWGTVTYKRQAGAVTFIQAFTAGLIIIGITIFFMMAMAYLIPNVIDTEYPQHLYDQVRNTTEEMMEKFGAQDEQIEEAMSKIKLENFQPTLLTTLRSFGIGVGVGAILCLLIAAFVSRPQKPEPQPTLTHEP